MSYAFKKGMTRGRLAFICTWLAIFAAAFLIWAFYLGKVTNELMEYDAKHPAYTAEEVFKEYFDGSDAEKIASCGKYSLSEYEDYDDVIKKIESMLEGKTVTYKETSFDENEARYEVLAGDVAFAAFTLKENEESDSAFGRREYVLSGMELLLAPDCVANIRAPKNAIVKLNGIALGKDHMIGDYIELDDAEYFPVDDPDSRLMVLYRVEGLYASPEVIVTNPEGNITYGVEYDRINSVYDTEFSYRTILEDIFNGTFKEPEAPKPPDPSNGTTSKPDSDSEYVAFLYEAITIYEKYIRLTNDANDLAAWRVLSYFKPGTEIYSALMSYYNDSSFFPDNYEFSDVKVEELVWSDETHKSFTCFYEMKAVMWIGGENNKVTETVRYALEVDVSGDKPLITSLKKSN
ncbi:MAG: hypothetical protein IJD70_06395 [Clostridia bacterium]|nr:hypothetical protein [Clostridia bacterium]